MEYCFGVDIGGTSVKLGLFQTDGTLKEKWEIPSRTENEGAAILPDIAETLEKKLVQTMGLRFADRYQDSLFRANAWQEEAAFWAGVRLGVHVTLAARP